VRRRGAVAAALGAGALCALLAATPAVEAIAARLTGETAPARAFGSNRLRGELIAAGRLALHPPLHPPVGEAAEAGRCVEPRVAPSPLAAAASPAARLAPEPWRRGDAPLVSLWLDPCRRQRLLSRPWLHGRQGEEIGWLALFERGELVFASAVGVRIHGGASREHPPYSLRLVFRREYGERGLPAAHVDPALEGAIARLVLDKVEDKDYDGGPWLFPAEVAHEIGRRLGAWAPRSRPVLFSLGGEPPRLYTLGEHVGADFLARHFGHTDFEMVRGKRDPGDGGDETWQRELEWIAAAPAPLTAERAGERYDVERLTTWILSVVFCATGDLYQEAMIRDRTGRLAGGRWTWIHWDHDMSFRTPPGNSRFGRQKDALRFLLANHRPPEAPARRLLRRLVDEDPEYRAYLLDRFAKMLDRELTPEVLEAIAARWEGEARALGAADLRTFERLRAFFAERPARVRRQLARELGGGPA
jgi:hypothetical protein